MDEKRTKENHGWKLMIWNVQKQLVAMMLLCEKLFLMRAGCQYFCCVRCRSRRSQPRQNRYRQWRSKTRRLPTGTAAGSFFHLPKKYDQCLFSHPVHSSYIFFLLLSAKIFIYPPRRKSATKFQDLQMNPSYWTDIFGDSDFAFSLMLYVYQKTYIKKQKNRASNRVYILENSHTFHKQ